MQWDTKSYENLAKISPYRLSNEQNTASLENIRNVYTFIKVVGGGTFGTVKLAFRKDNPDTKYAIKQIPFVLTFLKGKSEIQNSSP